MSTRRPEAAREPDAPARAASAVPTRPSPEPSGYFVLRTPLLPFTAVTEWGEGIAAPACLDQPELLEEALAADRERLRRRLEEIVTSPGFRDALFVASPSLEAGIDRWRKDPDSERGQRTEQALVCYFMRAAARPTPFGLFAGCTTGTVGAGTKLRLPGQDRYRRHTRLDMDYLWTLAEAVERDPVLRGDLRWRPNSSLYEVGDRLLYVEADRGKGGRSHRLVAVGKTPYLLQTLERARGGARLGALAAALTGEDITEAGALAYLDELVASQVLLADLQPQLTGPPPAQAFAEALAGYESTAGLARQLRQVQAHLAAIDRAGIGAAPDRYRQATALLAGAPAEPELSRFVQVDLTKPADGVSLGTPVIAALLQGVQMLHAFSRYRADEELRQFRERFTQRYETREMPLAQVLDEESGIGFGRGGMPGAEAAPLLAGLPLQVPGEPTLSWTRRDMFLLAKLSRALAGGDRTLLLDATDAEAVRARDAPPLPDAFEVLATVAAGSEEAAGRGDFQVMLHSASGPPGARTYGRFCHVDEEVHRLVRAHLRGEEAARPDCVFAEVVHVPEGRAGNIVCRPVLREYEIAYLARSGAPENRQLPLSDLLVSVRGEQIVLRSRKLGRQVIPRITNAHHYGLGLGVYRFLGALQHQGAMPGVTWDWGPMRDVPFLPRVVSGRAVLSRARWNLDKQDLSAFLQPRGGRRFAAVQRLRQRLGLPRHVALADSDNELAVDLYNVLSVEALAHQVRRRSRACLLELFPGPGELCVSGPEGLFAHQVSVPFVRATPEAAAGHPAPSARPAGADVPVSGPRRFPPGSEWLYLKLFTGPATADLALRRAAPALSAALAAGGADRWFFIRYGEPDWHVRLRVHGEPGSLLSEVLPLLRRVLAPLIETGQLWRVQVDTYEREVERYGGEAGIGPAERVFHADSEAVLAIVGQLGGDAGAALRWQVALLGIDLLFDDLGLTPEEKRALAHRARQGCEREFGAQGAFQHAISQRHRQQRAGLEALLDPDRERPPGLAASIQALRNRSTAAAPAVAEIRALAEAGRLTASLPDLALSFAHMHVNRMLRAAQRAQELVLYEMLDRLYRSQAAREAR